MKFNKRSIRKMAIISALTGGALGSAGMASAHQGMGGPGGGPFMGEPGCGMHGPMRGKRMHRMGMHGPMGMRGPMGMHGPMGKHMDGRLAFMKEELKITTAQEPAWTAFSDTVKSMAKEREAMFESRAEKRKAHQQLPMDQRIDQRLAMMQKRSENMKKIAEAFKTLYGQLTEEQRKAAESLPMARFL